MPWTLAHPKGGSIIDRRGSNLELAQSVSNLYALEGVQLPLASFDEEKIIGSGVTTSGITTSSVGTFKAYYKTEVRTSDVIWAVSDGNFFNGWNFIEEDFILDIPAKEGWIKGSATITGRKEATTHLGAEVGTYSAWELAIFANDVMVAQSGYIPVGVTTIDLPFGFSTWGEAIQLIPKWRIYNPSMPGTWDYPDFSISFRTMWAVNGIK